MMRRGLWIAVGVVVVIVLVALLIFGSYVTARNQMVAKQAAVQSQWANVQTQLQRRADLIPNLVATVKGYATHEEKVFDDVANANAGLLNAQKSNNPKAEIQANGQLDSALGRLLMLTQAYPDLKANQNFLALQDQLEGTENRIAVERRRYNLALQDYNTYVQQFPNNVWAGIAGFKPNDAYFTASPASQNAPVVKF
ncbi:MAG TPA: LemA family protein [Acidobacteriaceae bacterium]|nr:LemA family protein [Acidobacteriaceae bacterium]